MPMDSYHFAEVAAPKGAPLLLLLHGTGGDENNLIDLGRQVMPGAHLVSPRGDVSENGMPRFFRRLGMGVYDMADLTRATAKLGGFLRERIAATGATSVAALGYSNGANILASLLFEAPELVGKAVLMHPLIPFEPQAQPGLLGRDILITAGHRDPISPDASTDALAEYFTAQGANVSVAWHGGGHEIQPQELVAAREFLSGTSSASIPNR
jgi:phospholipase/carboxylesterase